MVTRLGTILGTQLGTDLGSFGEGPPVFDASKLYALTNLANANYYTTQAGGGEAGDVTTGFGGASIYMLNQLLPTAGNTGTLQGNYVFPTAGWRQEFTNPGSSTTMLARTIATSGTGTPTRTMLSSDLGKVALTAFVNTGAILRQYADDGTEIGAGIATTGFTPGTTAHRIGASSVAAGFTYGHTLAWITWRGTPTQAQIKAMFSAVRAAAGDFPSKAAIEALMPGTTVTHRWSLREVLAAANAPVIDSQAAPATIPDSVTAATVDVMTKTGTPVVRVIDPSLYPRTSYGALGWSDTNYLQAATGVRGAATGFTLLAAIRVDAISAGGSIVASNYGTGPTAGYSLYQSASAFSIYRAGSADLAVGTAVAADIGKHKLLGVTWNGTTWQAYENAVAGASAVNAMTYGSNAWRVGTYLAGGGSPGASSIFALGGCDEALSAGEIASVYADWQNTGRLRLPSGKLNTHLWDLTQDVVANGGPSAGVPATVLDRAGTDNLTRTGTGLAVSQRTERLWSYETSPILYGATALDLSNYYSCATALGEGITSFWTAMLFTVTSQAVASKSRVPFASSSALPTNISGFLMATSGTNTLVAMTAYNGLGGGVASPSCVIGPSDVGKQLLFVGVLDVPALKVRSYFKRAEQGTGSAYTAYSASAAGMRLGRAFLATDYSPDGISLWGVSAGIGLPSLAQIQALYDQTQATERIGSIPGMTSMRIDLTADALGNGNVLPATLTDRAGAFNFTQTGTVTTASTYARAFSW